MKFGTTKLAIFVAMLCVLFIPQCEGRHRRPQAGPRWRQIRRLSKACRRCCLRQVIPPARVQRVGRPGVEEQYMREGNVNGWTDLNTHRHGWNLKYKKCLRICMHDGECPPCTTEPPITTAPTTEPPTTTAPTTEPPTTTGATTEPPTTTGATTEPPTTTAPTTEPPTTTGTASTASSTAAATTITTAATTTDAGTDPIA